MLCSVTIRQLQPGHYEAFREAWTPQKWLPHVTRVIMARNDELPDQVLTATFVDLDTAEEADSMRDDPELLAAEEQRLHGISQHEELVVFKGVFRVAEEIVPPAAESARSAPKI
jgi:hypothetical protein